jgi:hypothetical protein
MLLPKHMLRAHVSSKKLQPSPPSGCAFIAPVKYPAIILVTVTAGQLTHSRIFPSLLIGLQDRQEGLGHPSARDMRRHHRGYCGFGSERAFLGKEHMYTTGEAIVWSAALGLKCAARAALVARTLTPLLAACAAPFVGFSSFPRPHSSSTTPRPPRS